MTSRALISTLLFFLTFDYTKLTLGSEPIIDAFHHDVNRFPDQCYLTRNHQYTA